MKLSVWAKSQGLSYKTAWRLWKDGKLPVPAEQLLTGTVIVHPPVMTTEGNVALYARVSSADQKPDLERQVARLAVYAAENSLRVTEVVKEIGSGLNGHRRGLMRLLRMPVVTTIVVEHRDRLMRFGFESVDAALTAQGRSLVVIDPAEVSDDLVRDLTEVLTSMGARLYGRRAAENRAKRALEAMQCEPS
ncbi:MAG: IS607 family transposase [Candidatus Competibacteraceae bacterium]|nr:IS607 family transposase [Candidatus Competibacteraceae bacterium]MBK8754024.1 IS607 family transposase [Candidatus Competibacteraceae bacterium]